MYKVVLVDDEPPIIETLSRNFAKTADFQVAGSAYMVSEALLLLEKHQPQVLLTDICMPGGSGISLIQHFSKHYPEGICIAVSGYDTFDYVRDAFLSGASDYLLKPISPAKFECFVEKLRISLISPSAKIPAHGAAKIIPGEVQELSEEETVELIERYLIENLPQDNSINTVCSLFSITQPYLSRIFRKYKHCSYNEFLTFLRIASAKRMLLQDDMLVGTVARLTGFSDQFYFSKVFKNETGYTPSEFRRNMRTGA